MRRRKRSYNAANNVISFPRDLVRPSDPAAVTVGQIVAVPPARHRKIVAFIAAEMVKQSTDDDAEEYLIGHLNIEWGRLSFLGIPFDEKDRHCRDFARAAWRIYFYGREAEGAA
jgi:hypothetical protein